ncbi:enoyl-[acyl-carrier-protein] reductase, mitochondrial [Microplitis mediator]|uniref:enoyl-[acyl-carrier-protein] reductase, mitochondrial n=1 Tax=Microplitis mediator TaxID=375433 RepID=UPI002557431C|nr:enoyl-[acyl-carrier-protein] reductase, mitochondrial [Microplitis mediator]
MSRSLSKLVFENLKTTLGYSKNQSRSISRTCACSGRALIYNNYGEPAEVLKLTEVADKKPEANQITVKWLLSSVNPADINTLQGKYPSRPSLPAVAGNEGVGEVIEVGGNVKNFEIGDRVVPNANNIGTWTTSGNYEANHVFKIPKSFGTVEASMLIVNPCTAYRMLKDFVKLTPGDTVIQNGGNSAVGQLVIQLCKIWELKSVNVVRDRDDIDELKKHLKTIGATEVLTEAELRTTDLFKSKKLPAPKLALNCVCGQNAVEVLRHLQAEGTMVTYGAMSREPLTVPASALIFKNISIRGFWMTNWKKAHGNSEENTKMFEEIGKLFETKKLQPPPYKIVPFSKYKDAVTNALNTDGKVGVKYIIDLTA